MMKIPKLTESTGAAYVAAHAAKITATRRKMLSSRRIKRIVSDCKRAGFNPRPIAYHLVDAVWLNEAVKSLDY